MMLARHACRWWKVFLFAILYWRVGSEGALGRLLSIGFDAFGCDGSPAPRLSLSSVLTVGSDVSHLDCLRRRGR